MRTTVIVLGLALCMISSVNAQSWGKSKKVKGNGNVITKTRNLSNYDQIKLKGSLDVALVSGAEGHINIKAESNLIQHIITEVDGDILKIYVEKEYYLKPSRNTLILITVPFEDISKVNLSGSGDISSKDIIKAESFETKVSGSGDVSLDVQAKQLEGSVSGSGDLTLKGSVEDLELNVTGSGDVRAYELKAKNVDASVTGSGNIKLTSTYSLKARISGSGNIDYQGNIEKEDIKITGSGDITKHQ